MVGLLALIFTTGEYPCTTHSVGQSDVYGLFSQRGPRGFIICDPFTLYSWSYQVYQWSIHTILMIPPGILMIPSHFSHNPTRYTHDHFILNSWSYQVIFMIPSQYTHNPTRCTHDHFTVTILMILIVYRHI